MKVKIVKLFVIAVFLFIGASFFSIEETFSSDTTNEEYNAKINENYDFRFGQDKPFAPSNANTYNGKFIKGDDFLSSEKCASCHTDVHPQWRQSAHANSFREPFYQKNVKDLISQRNIAFTRHCESCHNPAALFSGALTDKPAFKKRPFDKDGVSCIACHSIESVTGKGIGGYVMGQPAMLQKADGTKILEATDQEILDNVEDHKRAMMRPLLKQPEFCGACHKSQVPKELNDYKFLRAFAVADELQQSSFSKESPHPFYIRNKETCNTCHMKVEPTKFFDVSAKQDGVIANHRFASANTAIPTFYGYKEQLEEVTKFLQDDKLGVDIFALSILSEGKTKEKLVAPMNRKDFKIKGGDRLTADVVITNKNIGHSFPPELRDFYEAYVEFSVGDENGKILYKSGFIQPDGDLDDKAHAYKTYLVKEDGSYNDIHHIWKTKVVAHNLAIPSGRSDLARYRFTLPKDIVGKIKLTAKLQYRRFTRVFSDYALGNSTDLPIITMATSERNLLIGDENKSQPVDPKAMPDWRRWNNYGIALLDQRQFPQAVDAFDEVIGANNEYKSFAYINKALASMEMGGWQEAEKLLSKSLELDQNNMRAIFQRGRVQRVKSNLEKAEADFKAVLEKYPRDRQTLQQLGELAKIKSDIVPKDERNDQLKIAQGYYEKVLAIDPEDTSAHYNLMIICQKLGLREDAKREAAIFKDLKDDPTVTSLASNFLQTNWNIGNESLPFHTHDLSPFNSSMEKTDYIVAIK